MADSTRVPDEFINPIRQLVRDLMNGEFDQLSVDGRAGRLTADELREALEGYPDELIDLPEEAFEVAEAYPGPNPGQWAIDVDLWTAKEGHSDLTLELEARSSDVGVTLSIDGLHVL